jgi:hypothetical protein
VWLEDEARDAGMLRAWGFALGLAGEQ